MTKKKLTGKAFVRKLKGAKMKKIFIITCNPKEHSEKEIYVQTYIEEAQRLGHEIKTVNLYDLNIDYLKANGNDFDYSISDELKTAQNDILWADQLVFVYPIWWLTIPAIMKSFIERVFQDDVVSTMGRIGPEPLMKDKTAVIMQSYSMPYFALRYLYSDVTMTWWKIILTDWCGPKIVKRFDFDYIDNVPEKRKQKWIKNIKKFVKTL